MPMIYLEFQHETNKPGEYAANGSDIVCWIDGRWNVANRNASIRRRVASLREMRGSYDKQLFVGFTRVGDRSRKLVKVIDLDPPAWSR